MKLYRGDSSSPFAGNAETRNRGSTFPHRHLGSGMMSKFANGGLSGLMADKDILQLVIEHVGYIPNSDAQELAYHSPMLSFSSSWDCARAYCERRAKKRLEPCLPEEATHFMFRLDLDEAGDLVQDDSPGLFRLTYEADPVHCRGVSLEKFHRIYSTGSGPVGALAELLSQQHAASDERDHLALVVDVVRFVKGQPPSRLAQCDQALVTNTIQRATRDLEWLVYPVDGYGRPGRFEMNSYCRPSEWYRLKSQDD